ncbi:MAG: carboxypeptidase regulatory-like domain-containing protein [Polyangiaceae bacterium]|nr:carboxypeptidase regulatory-like domain-containing protein [Polyangiaceae bacterium]
MRSANASGLLLLGLLAFALGCDPLCIPRTGVRIQDESGEPIAGAHMEVIGICCEDQIEPHCQATSNAQGVAATPLPGGHTCTLIISAEGYQTQEHSIATTCQGDEFIDDVTLSANPP